jgi:inositol 1,4,5-triphosphate receptor type 1
MSPTEWFLDILLAILLRNPNTYYILMFNTTFYTRQQIESDSKLTGEMVKIFKNYERKILNNEKGELEDLLTGDNIVGQLISFARSLIESVLKYVDTVKKKAVDAVKSL